MGLIPRRTFPDPQFPVTQRREVRDEVRLGRTPRPEGRVVGTVETGWADEETGLRERSGRTSGGTTTSNPRSPCSTEERDGTRRDDRPTTTGGDGVRKPQTSRQKKQQQKYITSRTGSGVGGRGVTPIKYTTNFTPTRRRTETKTA